jgi:hypothetical protein
MAREIRFFDSISGFFLNNWLLLGGQYICPEKAKIKAQSAATMSDERIISSSLEESANSMGGLTNLNRQFILDSVFADNQYRMWLHTNGTGNLIDIWQTPYHIELVGPTNFVIHSAGGNQKFGDSDDVIYNSASNDFVKP